MYISEETGSVSALIAMCSDIAMAIVREPASCARSRLSDLNKAQPIKL